MKNDYYLILVEKFHGLHAHGLGTKAWGQLGGMVEANQPPRTL